MYCFRVVEKLFLSIGTGERLMINISVIEDEEWMRETIVDYLNRAMTNFQEVEYQTYESAETFWEDGSFCDILVLDIDLPGMNGIELGKRLRAKGSKAEFLYITSYPEYAADSYLVDAYQYILKEQIAQRLPQILDKLIDTKIRHKKDYRVIGIKGGKKKLFYRDIIYIQKTSKGGKYIEYVTTEDTYHERIPVGQLLGELGDKRFILLDRGHVVNAQYIEKIEGNIVYLITGESFAVSRVQIVNARRQITAYLEED